MPSYSDNVIEITFNENPYGMRRLHLMVSRLTHKTSDFVPQIQPSEFFTVLFSVFDSLVSVVSRRYSYRNYQNCPLLFSLVVSSYLSPDSSLFPLMTKRLRIASSQICFCSTKITFRFFKKFFTRQCNENLHTQLK